jgi:hypothetical protein
MHSRGVGVVYHEDLRPCWSDAEGVMADLRKLAEPTSGEQNDVPESGLFDGGCKRCDGRGLAAHRLNGVEPTALLTNGIGLLGIFRP